MAALTFVGLATRNALRRRLRTTVTMLGVAIAIAALFSLVSFQRGYQAGLRGELDRLGAHILVVPKGCPYDAASIALHGARWPCYLKEAYARRVRQTPGVEVCAPLLMNALYDPDSGVQTVYVGANADLLRVKRGWRIEGAFPVAAEECLVGAAAARSLRLHTGSDFTLPGLPGEKGRVSGILAPTQGADDGFVYLPLATAQRLFKRPGQLSHILVRLDDPDRLDAVVSDLRGCDAGMDMNVVPLTHLFRTIQGLVNSTRTLLGCVALIALLVAGAGVSNTVLMAVTERTREIGVMRAVGASRRDVFRLIWLETVQVCLAGGAFGILLAALGSHAIETWLRSRLPFSPDGALVHPEFGVVLVCLIWAAVLGSVAGVAPAWRASRLLPAEAIRSGGGGAG
jgi:putative ABC transport system permease protein